MSTTTSKKHTFILFLLLVTFLEVSAQQRYISRAIIAFSGGAYERTIKDINTALLDRSDISDVELGKAYFYRGMAKIRLTLKEEGNAEILGSNPYLSAYNDLASAIEIDASRWTTKSQKEFETIYDQLVIQGETSLRQARAVGAGPRMKTLLDRSKNYFIAALSIKTVPTVRNKLTEVNNLVAAL